MTRETLTLSAEEVRFATDDAGVFSGYAAIFGEADSYGDTIKPGAFRKTIASRKNRGPVAMFWNHDPGKPIGIWTSIAEDTKGLKVTGRLILETAAGAEAYALLKAGAVTGLSIGFNAVKSVRGPNGGRVLTELDLIEVSAVTLPAASRARVTNIKGAAPDRVAAFILVARRAAASITGKTR